MVHTDISEFAVFPNDEIVLLCDSLKLLNEILIEIFDDIDVSLRNAQLFRQPSRAGQSQYFGMEALTYLDTADIRSRSVCNP